MKKTRYFICPVCGSISLCTGNAEISCCGRKLEALEMKKALPEEKLQVEIVEDEWFISSNHPMEKDNYISFVAFVTSDRIQMVKLYPEGNAQTRLQLRGMGYLYYYCNQHGLFRKKK